MNRIRTVGLLFISATLLISCETPPRQHTAPAGLEQVQTNPRNPHNALEERWENLPPEERELRKSALEFLVLNNFRMELDELVKEIFRPYKEALPDIKRTWWENYTATRIDQSTAQDGLIEAVLEEFNQAELHEMIAYAKTPTGARFAEKAAELVMKQNRFIAQWEFEMNDDLEIELRRQKYLNDLSRLRIDDGGIRKRPDPPPELPAGLSAEEEQELRLEARRFLKLTGVDINMTEQITEMVDSFKKRVQGVPDAWWQVYVSTKMDLARIQNHLIQVVTSYFNMEELEDLNAFYETPSGAKLRDRLPIISQNHRIQNSMWAREVKNELSRELRREGYLK